MNKEELLKQYDEKAKALRDESISKLEFELTYPEDDEIVYYVSSLDGKITQTWYWEENNYDLRKFKQGQYFKTYEEAEQHLKERKLLFKLHQWAKMKNEDWSLDWDTDWNTQCKYYIYYNYKEDKLETSWVSITNNFKKLPYFKTREIAQECIYKFGEEIKEVLC